MYPTGVIELNMLLVTPARVSVGNLHNIAGNRREKVIQINAVDIVLDWVDPLRSSAPSPVFVSTQYRAQ